MSDFLANTFRTVVQDTHKHQVDTIGCINKILKGKDVILKWGKYKGRRAQIQEYYFDHGKEYLHVFIYRTDKRVGFKGREKFIDDHNREFLEYEDCELV